MYSVLKFLDFLSLERRFVDRLRYMSVVMIAKDLWMDVGAGRLSVYLHVRKYNCIKEWSLDNMNIFEFYKEIWNDFNLLGRIVLFPIFIMCFLPFAFVLMCFKKEL